MELHIFRHGETNWNAEGRAQSHMGSILTKLGENQASVLAQKVKGYAYEKIKFIISKISGLTIILSSPKKLFDIF